MEPLISEALKKEIFEKIQPRLINLGYKFKEADPKGSALSWWARYHAIVEQYNSSPDMHLIFDRQAGTQIQISSIDDTNKDMWTKSFCAYLRKAYKNDLLKDHSRNNLTLECENHIIVEEQPANPLLLNQHFSEEETVSINDLLSIIKLDSSRAKAIATTYTTILNSILLQSLVEYYSEMLKKFGNINIVKNYASSTSKDFFISDISDDRTNDVAQLMLAKATSFGKLVQAKILKMVSEPGKTTIKKRINGYFGSYKGGLVARLKKRKEK